ncbi:hypothetical protein WA158_006718 [Blastocystis sp. Blastoise]
MENNFFLKQEQDEDDFFNNYRNQLANDPVLIHQYTDCPSNTIDNLQLPFEPSFLLPNDYTELNQESDTNSCNNASSYQDDVFTQETPINQNGFPQHIPEFIPMQSDYSTSRQETSSSFDSDTYYQPQILEQQPSVSYSDNSSQTSSDSEGKTNKKRARKRIVDKLSTEEKKKKKEIRLARNRESAHRSRARHKEYVVNLEKSVGFLKGKVNALENALVNCIGKDAFLQLFNPEFYEEIPDEVPDTCSSSTSSSPAQTHTLFSVSFIFIIAFTFSLFFKPLETLFPFLAFSHSTVNDYTTSPSTQSQQAFIYAFMFQSFSSLLSPQLLSKFILLFDSDTLVSISYSLIFAFIVSFIYVFIVPHLWWQKPRWNIVPRKEKALKEKQTESKE